MIYLKYCITEKKKKKKKRKNFIDFSVESQVVAKKLNNRDVFGLVRISQSKH